MVPRGEVAPRLPSDVVVPVPGIPAIPVVVCASAAPQLNNTAAVTIIVLTRILGLLHGRRTQKVESPHRHATKLRFRRMNFI
jgi:hypothetical protein